MRAPASRDERGAAVIEFAIVLPLLLLFMFGIIEFGRAYSARIELTAAVREGARATALGFDGVAATRNAAAGLKADAITVPLPAPCPASPDPAHNAVVTASYPFEYDVLFFGRGTWTLNAKGVMRCGG